LLFLEPPRTGRSAAPRSIESAGSSRSESAPEESRPPASSLAVCGCAFELKPLLTSQNNFDYVWTCRVAWLVTNGIDFCCESFAFTCTMDKFEEPGARAFTRSPRRVPLPFTPGVLGWRVAEIMYCPLSLKG